jgi:hypothetical protein
MKYLQTYESLRDKMLPKTEEEIITSVKKTLGVNDNYIEVKINNPKSVKDIKRLLYFSDKYNVEVKDYDNNYVLICGDIWNIVEFIKFYTSFYMINKQNSKTFYIKYIKDNIIKDSKNYNFSDFKYFVEDLFKKHLNLSKESRKLQQNDLEKSLQMIGNGSLKMIDGSTFEYDEKINDNYYLKVFGWYGNNGMSYGITIHDNYKTFGKRLKIYYRNPIENKSFRDVTLISNVCKDIKSELK